MEELLEECERWCSEGDENSEGIDGAHVVGGGRAFRAVSAVFVSRQLDVGN